MDEETEERFQRIERNLEKAVGAIGGNVIGLCELSKLVRQNVGAIAVTDAQLKAILKKLDDLTDLIRAANGLTIPPSPS